MKPDFTEEEIALLRRYIESSVYFLDMIYSVDSGAETVCRVADTIARYEANNGIMPEGLADTPGPYATCRSILKIIRRSVAFQQEPTQ